MGHPMTADADINAAVASVLSRFPIGSHAHCGNGAGTVYAVGWADGRVWTWITGIGRVDATAVTR